MKSSLHITGLGEILWDIYPHEKHLGGAPANVARHVKNLGGNAAIVSAVGEDHFGDEIFKALSHEGIDTNFLQRAENKNTGQIHVTVDREGFPTFHCTKDQAFDFMKWDDTLNHLLTDAVVTGTLAQRSARSRNVIQKIIQSTHAKVVFDINFRQWDHQIQKIVFETLPAVHILKINEEEKKYLQAAMNRKSNDEISFLAWLRDQYKLDLIALTKGPAGCILHNKDQVIKQNGLSVEVRDTTGCGDAFTAGLLTAYLTDQPLEDVARFANAVGAWTATQTGAVPQCDPDTIYRLMETQT